METIDDWLNNCITKNQLFEEMFTISRKQLEVLNEAGDNTVDKLVKLVARRQQLMNKIDSLNTKIKYLENELRLTGLTQAELHSFLKDSQYTAYTSLQNNIRNIILSIQQNDEVGRQLGREVLAKIGDKMGAVKKHKKAYKAYSYGNDYYGGAWFIDKKK